MTYREKLRCPNCESEDIATKYAGQVPVRVCDGCALEYVDHEGEAMLGAQPIRCELTGNQCGTDTIQVGHECQCAPCVDTLSTEESDDY